MNRTKRTLTDWLKILILLLDEVAAVSLIILILHFVGLQIPLAVMIIIGLLVGIFVVVTHIAIIPSFRRKQITGREGMIGLKGTVTKPLTLSGIIIVNGEHWKAVSVDNSIDFGENVKIVGSEGLTLKVCRLK